MREYGQANVGFGSPATDWSLSQQVRLLRQSTKSLRDSPLRGGVTGRTVIVDRTSSLLRQKLGHLFYRSSGGA